MLPVATATSAVGPGIFKLYLIAMALTPEAVLLVLRSMQQLSPVDYKPVKGVVWLMGW